MEAYAIGEQALAALHVQQRKRMGYTQATIIIWSIESRISRPPLVQPFFLSKISDRLM